MTSAESFARARRFFWSLLLIGLCTILLIGYFEAKNFKESINYHDKSWRINDTHEDFLNQRPFFDNSFDLEFFKVLKTKNVIFMMLSAFYDARKFYVDRKRPEIKITALIDVIDPSIRIFCVLWFDGLEKPEVSEVHEYKQLKLEAGENFAKNGWNQFRLACKNPLAASGKVPKLVSIVEDPNDSADNKSSMEISFKVPKFDLKRPIAICTKPLTLKDDNSLVMIEWIETLKVLGIEKIYLNVAEVNENLMQVLNFYETEEKVEVRKFPQQIGNNSIETLVLNDCFLRHMHEYEFITFVDPDELIVPSTVTDRNLVDFMGRMIREKNLQLNKTEGFVFDGYAAPPTFFFIDDVPESENQKKVPAHFFFLRAIQSVAAPAQEESKCLHSTETVDVVHSNLPVSCLGDGNEQCKIMTFDRKEVKFHQYRRACVFEESGVPAELCNNFVASTARDLALWNWRDEIIFKAHKSITKLKALDITVNKSRD